MPQLSGGWAEDLIADEQAAAAPSGARLRAAGRRLAPPVQQVALIERERLLRSLDFARAGRLTIVTAPAGFGKTTLLGQWWRQLRARKIKAAWYTASEADAEPVLFLQMLTGALEAAGIDVGASVRQMLSDDRLEAALDAILSGLAQSTDDAVILIDEFERVEHPAIMTIMATLLEVLPDHLHMAIASRRKPQLPLSMMRVQGSARAISPTELRLTKEEMAAALELPADAPEIAEVSARTEGWPVAVQLYRLCRSRLGDHTAEMPFGGQSEEVADYLAEQVIAALPEKQRQLLLDLAVLDYAEAAQVDHLRGARDGTAMLQDLAGLLPALVQQCSTDGEIAYRLHPLLADYLYSQLERSPDRLALLHRRAAAWLWRHHRYTDATRHAVRCGDERLLLEMIATLPFIDIFAAYGVCELRAILREIPQPLVRDLPRLQLATALIQFKSGYFGEARSLLTRIRESSDDYRRLADHPVGAGEHEGLTLELLFTYVIDALDGPYEEMIERIRAIAPDQPLMLGWCEHVVFKLHQERGQLEAARTALLRAREAYRAKGKTDFAESTLLAHELLVCLAFGRLRTIAQVSTDLFRGTSDRHVGEHNLRAMVALAGAAIEYERSYRTTSADAMRAALEQHGEAEAWFALYAIALPVMADASLRRHGLDAARDLVRQFADRFASRGIRCLRYFLQALDLLCLVRAGALDTAADLAADEGLIEVAARFSPAIPWRERDLSRRALAAYALARGDHAEAIRLATLMVEEGRTGDRLGTWIKGLVLLARAQDGAGDGAAARATVHQAIQLAHPEGYVAPFAEEGVAILHLLSDVKRVSGSPVEQRHIAVLMESIDGAQPRGQGSMLSQRERQVLDCLSEGASNKEIARRLGMTDNTVKFHLRKIFAKMGVSTRQEAVAHASQLDEPPPPSD